MKRIPLIIIIFLLVAIGTFFIYTNINKDNFTHSNIVINLLKNDGFISDKLKDIGYGGNIYDINISYIQEEKFYKYILVTDEALKNPDSTTLLNMNIDKGSHLVVETPKNASEVIDILKIAKDKVMPGFDYSFGDYSVGVSIFKFSDKYYISNIGVKDNIKFSDSYYQSLLQGFLYNKELFIPGYVEPK